MAIRNSDAYPKQNNVRIRKHTLLCCYVSLHTVHIDESLWL